MLARACPIKGSMLHEQARRGHRVSVYSVGDETATRVFTLLIILRSMAMPTNSEVTLLVIERISCKVVAS